MPTKEKQVTKWVCQTDRTHIFDDPSDDGFCPEEPFGHGILLEEQIDPPPPPTPSPVIIQTQKPSISVTPIKQQAWVPEVGLAVILMDASSSMTDVAFEGNPLSKLRLVATTAATGIFDLERLQNNPNAFVAAFKFDDRVEMMFVDTVANIIQRFNKDVKQFANYIYDELSKMLQGTDINSALKQAYTFIDRFLQKRLPEIPVKYTPMRQRILTYNSDSVSIANVRVMIYTDGMQFDANENKTLLPNPFTKRPFMPDLNHDIVIGAFFGKETDEGCKELQSLLSRCPIHNELQFFLFKDAGQINDLRYLFRMASGASGFCPKCLEKQLRR